MRPLIMTMSGTRGVIGENLHPQIALKTAIAFGRFVKTGPVIVGGDTRTSYDMLNNAVISGLISIGIDVIDIGKVPTPTVQQMIRYHNASGGIVITASHNPIIWNGLKLMNKTGSFLEPDQYQEFLTYYQSDSDPLVSWDKLGKIQVDDQALKRHADTVLSVLPPDSIKKSGLRVLIDANNGAGAVADPFLMDQLGIEYEILNGEPNGHFAHDPEPMQKNLSQIMTYMKNGRFDIGFVQDADADRLVILDETGRFIGEDYSLALSVDYLLSKETDTDKTVVVNLSTSNVIRFVAEKHGAKLVQTKIGETNVTHEIKARKAQVGGEGNGGVIYPKVGWGRDSLVGIMAALGYLAESGKKVSELVAGYPAFVMIREKIEVSSQDQIQGVLDRVKALFSDLPQNTIDGIKIDIENGWIHVRPSNTEPIVRIFIEAESIEKAQAWFLKIQKNVLTI